MDNQKIKTKTLIVRAFLFLLVGGLVIHSIFRLQDENQKNSLQAEIEPVLSSSHGTYGIVVKNLKTGESFSYNQHKVYESASLYKLWIMAAAYQQIQNGSLQEDEELSESIPVLNQKFNIASDAAELTDGVITLPVSSALVQMITISHNYAALLLTERIKLSSVNAFLQKYHFNESKIGTDGEFPTTTAFDIALFFEKLQKGELANKKYTTQMIDLLKKQQLNNKLPKYLPKSVVIAHKTGEIDLFTHDGGIVYLRDGEYIMVVLSQNNPPEQAEETIALLSKAVYAHFEKSIHQN